MVVEDGKATFDQELDFAVRRAEAGGREVGRRGEERRVRDDVVEVKLKPSLGEGGKARAPSHAHGGWWRAVGAAERSTHWSSPSSLASISRHAFVKRSASHTTFEIVLAVETRRSPRSLLVSCRISDACDVMRRRRRESDMAMRALPRQNSATMERICLFGVHDGCKACQLVKGKLPKFHPESFTT